MRRQVKLLLLSLRNDWFSGIVPHLTNMQSDIKEPQRKHSVFEKLSSIAPLCMYFPWATYIRSGYERGVTYMNITVEVVKNPCVC